LFFTPRHTFVSGHGQAALHADLADLAEIVDAVSIG
jgi:hypothetical protein